MNTTRWGFTTGPDDPRHGTANGYNNLECRCDRCREAWRTDPTNRAANVRRLARERQARRDAGYKPPPASTHGELRHYRKGCHCDQCRRAAANHRAQYRNTTTPDTAA